jgi:hypothetical protein
MILTEPLNLAFQCFVVIGPEPQVGHLIMRWLDVKTGLPIPESLGQIAG